MAKERGSAARELLAAAVGLSLLSSVCLGAGASGAQAALLDGRMWELVSPPNKSGALILPYNAEFGGETQASASGQAIAYQATAPTEAAPEGYANDVAVLSSRTAHGWTSRDLIEPHATVTLEALEQGAEYRYFSSELTQSVVQPFGAFEPTLSPEASEQTAFLRTDYLHGNPDEPCASPCLRPLVTGAAGVSNVPQGTVFGTDEGTSCPPELICGPRFLGAAPDLGHIVLESSVALEAGSTGRGLYEWYGGQLRLVSVLPDGQAAGEATLGSANHVIDRAISNDGSRVVFSTTEGGDIEHLYMRVHADEPQSELSPDGECSETSDACTVQLDSVQEGAPSGYRPAHATFVAASADGSRVFFTDTQALTRDSGASENARDLYECEVLEAPAPTCRLTDMTPVDASGEKAYVLSVLGASEEGSYVYFVAEGSLAGDAASRADGHCEEGQTLAKVACNLYLWHEGTIALVAVLGSEDYNTYSGTLQLEHEAARVAPNGQWLAFMSQLDLADYDTTDALNGRADQEVYLYDASTHGLVCVSCIPSGTAPVGAEGTTSVLEGARQFGAQTVAAVIPAWESFSGASGKQTAYQSRYLSDSGRLFFDGYDSLAPQAVNGTWNVYEYEPFGVGECETTSPTFQRSSEGCVGLISSGASTGGSAFLDASEGGSDAFFLTNTKLVPQDYDENTDVYDAHVCTGSSPCPQAGLAIEPSCDSTETCSGLEGAPPPITWTVPASATTSAAGNPVTSKPRAATGTRHRSAERLARALRACRRRRMRRRTDCERRARRRYGTKPHKLGDRRKGCRCTPGRCRCTLGRR